MTFVFEKNPYSESALLSLFLDHHLQIGADFLFGVRTDKRDHKKYQGDCDENFYKFSKFHF
jgi:hypothetical protein